MTRWTDAELTNIRRTLVGYSHEAVAHLIDAVTEEPERAQQLTIVLDETLARGTSQSFFPLACCVALSEAGFVKAADVLFDAGTIDPTPPVETAARVALQRLGEPALRRVITRIDEAKDPFARSFGYAVLEAGVDADQAFRSEVTDFCSRRATSEGKAPQDRQWGEWPAFTACATSAKLGGRTIRSTVEWWLCQEEGEVPHDLWQDLLVELDGAYATNAESHPWQQSWPTLCRALLAEMEQHDAPSRRASPKMGATLPVLAVPERSTRSAACPSATRSLPPPTPLTAT